MGTACSYFSLIRVLTRFLLLACEVVRLVGFPRLKRLKKRNVVSQHHSAPLKTFCYEEQECVAKVRIICDICEYLQYY